LHDAIRNEEVNVIRGQYGLSMTQKVHDVVVGDVIIIEQGMRIPADCILFEGIDVTVDETIYHENRETIIKKSVGNGKNHRENPDPFLLSRSLVMSGKGKALVCCVGKHTQLARQPDLESFGKEEKLTPLQEKLERIAGQIGKYAYLAGFVIFATQVIFLLFLIMISEEKQLLQSDTLSKLLDFFTTALAIIIVAVPEGLPLAVSISMAFSIDTMKRDNLLVKNLEACETMGTVTDICTGKTATLTNNEMQVNAIYTAKLFSNVKENSTLDNIGLPRNIVDLVKDVIILNCDSRVEMSAEGYYVAVGNGIEVGMLKFLQQSHVEVQDLLV
jgi:magnesium-transporting ATPase (P-type)